MPCGGCADRQAKRKERLEERREDAMEEGKT